MSSSRGTVATGAPEPGPNWWAVLFLMTFIAAGSMAAWILGAALCRWAGLSEAYAVTFPATLVAGLGLSWARLQ